MKKTLLLFLFLFLASMKAFAVSPNYDSRTHIVTIPRVIVTENPTTSVMYENVELLLNPDSTWVILKASLLDIEFTDAETATIPDFDLPTRNVYFPVVTVDKGKDGSTADLILAVTGRWTLAFFGPVEPVVAPAAPAPAPTTPAPVAPAAP